MRTDSNGKMTPHVHAFDYTTTVEATCCEPGLETGVCSCGEITARTIPTTPHDYVYTGRGKENYFYYCSICGDIKSVPMEDEP